MNQDNLESLETFRAKRKWQIALRRYVLEQKPCPAYAPYFALPIRLFREWIERQFDNETTWANFSEKWQFDHAVPVAYFDFSKEEDLLLCWNFTNIRVEKENISGKSGHTIDALAAKTYFSAIAAKTGYHLCRRMVKKIEAVEKLQIDGNDQLEKFIADNLNTLKLLEEFTQNDFERVNWGLSVEEVIAENKLLSKYGSFSGKL